jgi:SAM-dependent methyltransferase
MNVTARQPWYVEWFNSPFYHKLYFERNEEETRAFITKLISHLQPSQGSYLLDTACGRGRHSRILSSTGFDVTGVDMAPDSIATAKQSETENLHFYIHDIRLPFWINYFDYAFNFFNSFGYFRTRREHDDAIRTLGGSLRPGGILVIDYVNVHYAEEHMIYNETQQISNTIFDIHRWQDDTHFFKKITISDPGLKEPLSFTEKLAKFTLGDFTDMLSFQSLQVQEVFGDYQLSPYHLKNTPRLIIIARKKSNDPADKEKRLYSDGRTTDALP